MSIISNETDLAVEHGQERTLHVEREELLRLVQVRRRRPVEWLRGGPLQSRARRQRLRRVPRCADVALENLHLGHRCRFLWRSFLQVKEQLLGWNYFIISNDKQWNIRTLHGNLSVRFCYMFYESFPYFLGQNGSLAWPGELSENILQNLPHKLPEHIELRP